MFRQLNKILNVLLAMAGIVVCIFLLYQHYALYNGIAGDSFKSLCKVNELFDCEVVTMSKWSVIAGAPVALWGLFGFIGYIFLYLSNQRYLSAIAAACMLTGSLSYFYISKTEINAYCPFCIAVYTIVILIIISIFLDNLITIYKFAYPPRLGPIFKKIMSGIKADFHNLSNNFNPRLFFTGLAIAFFIIIILYPSYWKMPPVDYGKTVCGVTEESNPFIESNQTPLITIEQYGDYACQYCKNGQRIIRRLISKGAKARLVHKNYPLSALCNPLIKDPSYHKASCGMSLLAIAALETYDAKTFWRINDFIYNNSNISFEELKKLNVNVAKIEKAAKSKPVAYLLAKDVLLGIKHEITGTPAYFVDGEKKHLPEVLSLLRNTMKGKS